jgi:pantoate--beta-alanine ligase
VAVSIFVNPTQFGPHDDFQQYPRDLARDLRLLEPVGVDTVFVPSVEEMYPAEDCTVVTVGGPSIGLEGAARPGHFQGVATVVLKLLHLVQPQWAYFGEKDYQQLCVIRHMVRDLHMAIEVTGCPTVREPDGLAMSSRNIYLSPQERTAARVLSHVLFQVRARVQAGERAVASLIAGAREILEQEPLARIDYLAVVDPAILRELDRIGPEGAVACLAVRIGRTRLIDNVRVCL